MYDCLYKKNKFEAQIIDLYLKRIMSLSIQNRRNIKIDINNDSNDF